MKKILILMLLSFTMISCGKSEKGYEYPSHNTDTASSIDTASSTDTVSVNDTITGKEDIKDTEDDTETSELKRYDSLQDKPTDDEVERDIKIKFAELYDNCVVTLDNLGIELPNKEDTSKTYRFGAKYICTYAKGGMQTTLTGMCEIQYKNGVVTDFTRRDF